MTTRMLTALALVLALGPSATRADDPKLPDPKAFDGLVIDTLREVHNKGADLYNTTKDFSGAYRLYQGALTTVRPLLAHRPDAQKIITDGLGAAEKEPDAARKAFLLHEAIEGVRKNLKAAPGERKPDEPKKTDDKKPEEPKKKPDGPKKIDNTKPVEPPKKPDDKKPDAVARAPMPKAPKAKADPPAASVGGKITFAGKPMAEGEVTVVSLNLPLPRVFTATIKDGTFKFTDAIPPGTYAAMVTGKGVPEKYQLISTAGLRLEFAAGANTTDLVLK